MTKYLTFVMVLGLVGCSVIPPYVDTYSGEADGHSLRRSTPDKVAICFDKADQKTLQKMATAECAKTSRKAVYDTTVPFSCSLITPNTAYFDCK